MNQACKRVAGLLLTLVLVAAAATGRDRRPPLTCSPNTLAPGDTLLVKMGLPHPAELAIRHPDGTFFFLVYEPDPEHRPLYTKQAFQAMSELAIHTRDTKGTPWVAGRKANELIFTTPGTYEVILTEVLETEDIPVYTCKVRYAPAV